MPEVRVFGSSDDLVEVEGDLREEFSFPDDLPNLLAFSDGTVLRIGYSPSGVWRITPVVYGRSELTITQVAEDDDDSYTDVATLTSVDSTDLGWCVFGSAIVRSVPGA